MEFREAFAPRRALRRGWGVVWARPLIALFWLGATLMSAVECHPAPGTVSQVTQEVETAADEDDAVVVDVSGGRQEEARQDPVELSEEQQAAVLMVSIVSFFIVGFLLLTVEAFLHPGWLRFQVDALQGRSPSWKRLFSGGDRFVRMWGWKLLSRALGYLVLIMAAGPSVLAKEQGAPQWMSTALFVLVEAAALAYLIPGLLFGSYAVTLDGAGPVVALRRSWRLARGHRGRLLLFVGVLVAFQVGAFFAGLLALCVGALVALPLGRAVADLALTDAYLAHCRSTGRRPG